MSQFEEIPSPGRGFQGSRALGLAATHFEPSENFFKAPATA